VAITLCEPQTELGYLKKLGINPTAEPQFSDVRLLVVIIVVLKIEKRGPVSDFKIEQGCVNNTHSENVGERLPEKMLAILAGEISSHVL
jgi:hypothetical protein